MLRAMQPGVHAHMVVMTLDGRVSEPLPLTFTRVRRRHSHIEHRSPRP